jgi:spoIIIJ-associated protein
VEWVEVPGKTIEEATQAALDQLGVAESDAEVIVVTEPKTGLFGRVRGEARVRARVRPVGPRPKRVRSQRDRSRSEGSGGSRTPRNGRTNRSIPRPATDGEAPKSQERRSPAAAGSTGSGSNGGGNGTNGTGTSRSARRRRSRSSERTPTGERRNDNEARRPENRGEATEENPMAEGMTLQDQADAAREFLSGLLDQFGFTAELTTRVIDEDTVEIAAQGDDLGILVGPRGSTLAALQDVTRTVVQRQFPAKTDRILVDVAGYRERRAEALKRFTQQIASEVIESGTERALEPMSPADRKVVHDSVNDIDGVVTRSEGEDPARYVVVAPG